VVTVFDTAGNPVAGVYVALTETSGSATADHSELSGYTDATGTFVVTVSNSEVEVLDYTAVINTGSELTPVPSLDPTQVTFTDGGIDPSNANTTVVATGPVIADGVSVTTITVSLADAGGNLLPTGGATVTLISNATGEEVIADVIDNGDGTYTFTATNTTAETVSYTASVGGIDITATADVIFMSDSDNPDVTNINTTVIANPTTVIGDGVATTTITVTLADAFGNLIGVGGEEVTLISDALGSNTISEVVDNGDGTYTFIVSNDVTEAVTYIAFVNGVEVSVTALVDYIDNPVLTQIGLEGDEPDTNPSEVTTEQLESITGITGVVEANEEYYQDYIDAHPELFSSPATVEEVQAMIDAVNAIIALVEQADAPYDGSPSIEDLEDVGVTNLDPVNEWAYEEAIANEDPQPTTLEEIQAIIDRVNQESANVVVPSTFTPNGDGVNDLFMVKNLQHRYPNFSMNIYNRWGTIVYKYMHNGNPDTEPIWWDGKSQGRMTMNSNEVVTVGTYYYVLEFNDGVTKPQLKWVYVTY